MTNLKFAELEKRFRNNDFPSIERDKRGIRFLKLRSMSRKATMEEFCELHNIDLHGLKSKDYFRHIFENKEITDPIINDFIMKNIKKKEKLGVIIRITWSIN